MPSIKYLVLAAVVSLGLYACKSSESSLDTRDALIPKPVSVTKSGGAFKLTKDTKIILVGEQPEMGRLGKQLGEWLKTLTGFNFVVTKGNGSENKGDIVLRTDANSPELGEEGYTLKVSDDVAVLAANQPAGIFRGMQTIFQLLPTADETGSWSIPGVGISDHPVYAYRGSMLDVSRHFFSVADVKRYIDLMAAYKMNVLHLHLSDDQGWRIEIKSWPKLTETGGSSQVGGGKGGFYTQEEYKDIVAYAAERFITIIPEIDMPGHTNAALASYPELNCNDTATKIYTGTEVGFSTLCVNKDITYKFIDDVVRELAAITPGPYIHIGGDESHATKKEDYITFMNKVQPIVTKYGKTVVGWDEIANATLQPNTVVQFWADEANSLAAVQKGARVIMSPAKKAYLDMQYDSTTKLGLHWAGYIEVDTGYIWDPANYVKGIGRDNILGVEAPLWTETIVTMDDIEYMVFPRLPGYAEIGWSPAGARNWEDYRKRLAAHGPRLKAIGVDFYPSKKVDWK
jgi:hexosaminidase